MTVTGCLLRRFADELSHTLYAPAPQILVPVEDAPRGAESLEIGTDDLPPPDAVLGDKAGALEDGDVLLHRGEAHRVVRGQLGHTLLPFDRPADDVPAGWVTQCAKDEVVVEGDLHIDTTIRLYQYHVKAAVQPTAPRTFRLFLDLVAHKYHAVFERGGLDELQVLRILEDVRSLAA
jgi:hypothetical protein